LLSGLILIVTHYGELAHFVRLVRQAEPLWLIMALLLQSATYVSVASVWYLALRKAGLHHSFISLIPIWCRKTLFRPGDAHRRHEWYRFLYHSPEPPRCPDSPVHGLLAAEPGGVYGACLLAAALCVLLLWFYQAIDVRVITVVVVFFLVAPGIPAAAMWLRSLGRRQLPPFFQRFPGLAHLMESVSNAPGELLRSPALVVMTMLLHGAVLPWMQRPCGSCSRWLASTYLTGPLFRVS